jgi:hypothetical protein
MTTNTTPKSGWIECAALEHGAVSAKRDGRSVRISYRSNGSDEADGLVQIRESVEAALGLWIETPSWHRWSAAEGEGEVVQNVRVHWAQPSHEIIWTPEGGQPVIQQVAVVVDHGEDIGDECQKCVTRQEVDTRVCWWIVSMSGAWLHGGHRTPHNAPGVVEVRRIETGEVEIRQVTFGPADVARTSRAASLSARADDD